MTNDGFSIWIYVVLSILGIPSWICFSYAIKEGLDNQDMEFSDYVLGVIFGLIPLIQSIPLALIILIVVISTPVLIYNKIKLGRWLE